MIPAAPTMPGRLAALLAAALLASSAGAQDIKEQTRNKVGAADVAGAVADADLRRQIEALAPQRPGHRDLYVLGFAGDGSEQVFRNEVLYLRDLAGQRLDAAGRVLVLANHAPEAGVPPLPPANAATLHAALAALGAAMDPDEDVLLLYITTHGTPEHELLLTRPGQRDRLMTAAPIRAALDASGIRHRVVVVSACYAGGFARPLATPDTLLIMAARRDRPSFGCGVDSTATYFGEAFLVGALNRTVDFVAAFEQARDTIRQRERSEDLPPSQPQVERGARIAATLADWRGGFAPGPLLAYPYAAAKPDLDIAAGAGPRKGFIVKRRPGGTR